MRECRAVGVPDAHYGEEVCLCVQLSEGAQLSEAELRERLSRVLARYKVPRYILFVEDFPRTNTGKVRASELMKRCCVRLFGEAPSGRS